MKTELQWTRNMKRNQFQEPNCNFDTNIKLRVALILSDFAPFYLHLATDLQPSIKFLHMPCIKKSEN